MGDDALINIVAALSGQEVPLALRRVEADGNCFFRAVAYLIFGCVSYACALPSAPCSDWRPLAASSVSPASPSPCRDEEQYDEVRRAMVVELRGERYHLYLDYVERRNNESYAEYCRRMTVDGQWAGAADVLAVANAYNLAITIHKFSSSGDYLGPELIEPTPGLRRRYERRDIDTVHHAEVHYDAAEPVARR